MKNILLITFLFLGQLAFGQTENHIKVHGTKCSLIPPLGFETASTFSGFQNAEIGASIMINELPAPYQTIVDGFTEDALKSRGMTVVNKQTIDLNGSKATLLKLTQFANGINYIKLMLIFGDINNTVLVNGIFPEESKDIEEQMKDALRSIVYNKSQNENPLEAATFTIDILGSDFKLVKYMSGSLLYSTDGKMPTENPILIVGNSLINVSPDNQRKYSEDRIKELPRGEYNVIKEIDEIAIDNLKGFEIVAEGKTKDNNAELVYQVMLYDESGNYYIIIGMAKEEFDKYIASFKMIARTFKRK